MHEIDLVGSQQVSSTQRELEINLSPEGGKGSSPPLFILSMQDRVAVNPEGVSEFDELVG